MITGINRMHRSSVSVRLRLILEVVASADGLRDRQNHESRQIRARDLGRVGELP
jgi:hypothetical protein